MTGLVVLETWLLSKVSSLLKSWFLDENEFRGNRLPCTRVGGVDYDILGILKAQDGI